jgi:hypothetical protein
MFDDASGSLAQNRIDVRLVQKRDGRTRDARFNEGCLPRQGGLFEVVPVKGRKF